VGARHALQDPEEEIVEPLPVVALAGLDVLHAATPGRGLYLTAMASILVSH
jgi:hypothetical protein